MDWGAFINPQSQFIRSLIFQSEKRERRGMDAGELKVAAEFLTRWLPFLTSDLCDACSATLRCRIDSLRPVTAGPRGFEDIVPTGWDPDPSLVPTGWDTEPDRPSGSEPPPSELDRAPVIPTGWGTEPEQTAVPTGWEFDSDSNSDLVQAPAPTGWISETAVVPTGWDADTEAPIGQSDPVQVGVTVKMSWADMVQEEEEEERRSESGGEKKMVEFSRDLQEEIRFRRVQRKKDFICLERVKGKVVNVLQGLELHTGVFNAAEQKKIVAFVYELQRKGQNGELGEHTYSKPKKWMRGKGRETIQFGCAYNYAKKNGNLPGILQNVIADPLPHLFKEMIKRLIQWHVLPASCVPDSCIVNIYEPEDCIPPHIDSHDFVRPFCTVSFLSECNILFGSELKIAGPGEFTGPFSIPLPVGSVLVLNGNSSDVSKHCVPAVPTKRISITFRRMDERKRPTDFVPELDLLSILPLSYETGEVESNDHRSSAGSQSEKQMNGSIKEEALRRKPGYYFHQGHPSALGTSYHQVGGEALRGKPGYYFHQGHPSTLGTSYHQVGDSEMSKARGRNYVGRWFELKTDQGLLGASPHRADGYTSRQRLQRLQVEGSASWVGRSQQSGRSMMIAEEEEPAHTSQAGGLLINRSYGGELSRRKFSLSSVKVQ